MDLAEQVLAELRRPFRHNDEILSGLASIGVAGFPEHDRKPTELLKDADLALYAAKAQGAQPRRRLHARHAPPDRAACDRHPGDPGSRPAGGDRPLLPAEVDLVDRTRHRFRGSGALAAPGAGISDVRLRF